LNIIGDAAQGHFKSAENFHLTILEWIPVMVDTVLLIIWLLWVALMTNFRVFE
jgi:hypothetical protein